MTTETPATKPSAPAFNVKDWRIWAVIVAMAVGLLALYGNGPSHGIDLRVVRVPSTSGSTTSQLVSIQNVGKAAVTINEIHANDRRECDAQAQQLPQVLKVGVQELYFIPCLVVRITVQVDDREIDYTFK